MKPSLDILRTYEQKIVVIGYKQKYLVAIGFGKGGKERRKMSQWQ